VRFRTHTAAKRIQSEQKEKNKIISIIKKTKTKQNKKGKTKKKLIPALDK